MHKTRPLMEVISNNAFAQKLSQIYHPQNAIGRDPVLAALGVLARRGP